MCVSVCVCVCCEMRPVLVALVLLWWLINPVNHTEIWFRNRLHPPDCCFHLWTKTRTHTLTVCIYTHTHIHTHTHTHLHADTSMHPHNQACKKKNKSPTRTDTYPHVRWWRRRFDVCWTGTVAVLRLMFRHHQTEVMVFNGPEIPSVFYQIGSAAQAGSIRFYRILKHLNPRITAFKEGI